MLRGQLLLADREGTLQGILRFFDLSFVAPGRFGRREAHASHGGDTPAAEAADTERPSGAASAGLTLDGGQSEETWGNLGKPGDRRDVSVLA